MEDDPGILNSVEPMKFLGKSAVPLILVAVVLAQTEPPPVDFMRISPILNAVDANQDSTLSSADQRTLPMMHSKAAWR